MKLEDHPTVQLKTVPSVPSKKESLDAGWLKQLVLDAGASGLRTERMGEASFLASLSVGDLAAGERLLQVGHPVSRHLGGTERQRGELFEFLQFLQARIRHLGDAEGQRGEFLEMLQLL